MATATVFTVLLMVGFVAASDGEDGRINDGRPIENCCTLGYKYTTFGQSFGQPGVYSLKYFCGNRHSVSRGYCDTITDGGGWLVIQRRQDGSVDFDKYWAAYEDGFGSLTGEFWYGLRALHCLTNQGQWELRVDTKLDGVHDSEYTYSNFRVGPPTAKYPLTISGFNNPPYFDDPFSSHPLNGMKFTTRDRDNDLWFHNCGGAGSRGGWWHNQRTNFAPNGKYNSTIGLNNRHCLPFMEIKIRRKNCFF